MSTVDERDGDRWVDAKGAPEALLPRCTTVIWSRRTRSARSARPSAREVLPLTESYAGQGLRVLAVAQRRLEPSAPVPEDREQAERGLCFLGLVAMFDPPRPEVADAVAACHEVPKIDCRGGR